MIVYRGVATDARPGAVPAESDSYIVEIAGPGTLAAEGFAADDEMDRYGTSQQMVIVKTERLIARAASLAPEERDREALTLAAEQRRVRAEFVFMLGGEQPEDIDETAIDDAHEHDTAGEDDVLAGRLANRGRIDLVRAIRSMSRAAAFLVGAQLDSALVLERAALASLQRAFARTRYILRALTERERIDLSRRLTGSLAGAVGDMRVAVPRPADPPLVALRAALAGIATLANRVPRGGDDDGGRAAADASELAQRVLSIDPGSEPLRRAGAHLTHASNLFSAQRGAAAASALDSATLGVAAVAQQRIARGAAPLAPPGFGELAGALTDALARAGSLVPRRGGQ
jgi:hypothetical protein